MRLWILFFAPLLLPATDVAAAVPGQVLDLSPWKLTVPIAGPDSKTALEVRQPQLAIFQDLACFFVDRSSQVVVFRAACGGVTTKGSKYPRCELRELYGNVKDSAAVWSTGDGKLHRLMATLAISHLPVAKPEVVCAQIHDAKNDVLMVRLDGLKLLVERNKASDVILAEDYRLGTFFDLKIETGDGHVRLWYNSQPKMDWELDRDACYFKIGCYTQSNPTKGDSAEAYGEVLVRKLEVTRPR